MLTVDTASVGDVAVLHAETDEHARRAVEQFLRLELDGVRTLSVDGTEAAIEHVEQGDVGCVVSEYRSDSLDGLALLRAVRDRDSDVPFLFFSDVEESLAPIRAIDEGADGFYRKTESTRRYVRLAQRVGDLVSDYERRDTLAETVRDFSRLFDRTDDVFWMYTADWEQVVFVNSSYEDVWGQPVSALEEDPRAFLDATHPDHRERVIEAMETVSNGSTAEVEFRVNPEDGFNRWVWVEGAPITDTTGGVEYVAGYVRDITERREQQQELERRTRQLERQAEQREFFNSVLRHDVLNGMNVIRGRSEYLVDELDDDAYREQAETIYTWADELIDLIDRVRAILDAISDDERDRELEPVGLDRVVEKEIDRVAAAYPEATFETDVPEGTTVRANELLGTVVSNLLTNAVEHNEPAGLTVTVRATDEGPYVHVEIADTGRGIPDERKEAVFSRGESTRGRTKRGGLGLYMVETVVSAYGGAVWIEDNHPRGTVVCLDLPAADSSEK